MMSIYTVRVGKTTLVKTSIEGINIEYGKIENCKIDTILTSKILRLVTSKR